MAICEGCGKEIEDGKTYCDLCEELSKLHNETGEQIGEGEDLSELFGMLSDHYEEEDAEQGGDSIGLGDIFDDALSAISYMENEQPEEVLKEEPEEMPEKILAEEPEEMPEEVLKEEPEEMPEEVLEEEPEETAEDVDRLLAEAASFDIDALEEPFGLTEDAEHEKTQEENTLGEMFGESLEQMAAGEKEEAKETRQPILGKDKNSFFHRIKKKYFDNIIDEETIAKEDQERLEESPEEQEKRLAEKQAEKEEKLKAKEEKLARKKEEKNAKEEEKRLMREEKAAKKQAKKEAEKNAYVGKVNPVGAAIVLIFFMLIGGSVFFGMKIISYRSSIGEANTYFQNERYEEAFQAIAGVSISESDEPVYQKARILASMQSQIRACDEYLIMKMPLQALDSLLKGVEAFDREAEESERLEIKGAAARLAQELSNKLDEEFHMSLAEARQILRSATREEYTKKLMQKIA